MKKHILLTILAGVILAAGCSDPADQGVETDTGSPITIYYGLNGSGSRSWAQINRNGVTGITYFQRTPGSPDQGTLVYQTIHPDGTGGMENVADGTRLEKSVLLFDRQSNPHIFVASSDDTDQIIDHHARTGNGQWQRETIVNFLNEGGRFIYELSADTGPGDASRPRSHTGDRPPGRAPPRRSSGPRASLPPAPAGSPRARGRRYVCTVDTG